MEPSRDNPLFRFSTFWLAVGIFLIFAVLLGVVYLVTPNRTTDLEAEAAKGRYEIKAKVDAAEAASLPAEAIAAAIPQVAKEIVSSKPVAVETPQQVVPGSPTALKNAPAAAPAPEAAPAAPAPEETPAPAPAPEAAPESKPAETPAAPAPAAPEAAPETSLNEVPDPAVMELGRAQFLLCAACHGQAGQGALAPALAGSEWVTGPVENVIRIQLRGLTGPIKVKGVEHNVAGGMQPMAYQSDEQIAAVLTYTRNSFGNKASSVKPAQVAALRTEVGKPMLTADELILP
ncbi:MAG: cytochrome c [Luteolibacter sp.]